LLIFIKMSHHLRTLPDEHEVEDEMRNDQRIVYATFLGNYQGAVGDVNLLVTEVDSMVRGLEKAREMGISGEAIEIMERRLGKVRPFYEAITKLLGEETEDEKRS